MPRWFDVLISGLGLLLLSPVFLLVTVAIMVTSRGSIFYIAKRMGANGRPFSLYKFRTMVQNADAIGSGITSAGDARVTTVGRILRATKIDELPQLINVLKGDMSFVGPRPEDPRFVEHYPEDLKAILQFKPGITSPASIAYRNESALLTSDNHEQEYIDRILPDKLRLDLEYSRQASFLSGFRLILKTIAAVFRRENVS